MLSEISADWGLLVFLICVQYEHEPRYCYLGKEKAAPSTQERCIESSGGKGKHFHLRMVFALGGTTQILAAQTSLGFINVFIPDAN